MRPSISSITASLIGWERPSSSRSWQAASHLSIQAGAANAAPGPADARAVTQAPSAGSGSILRVRARPLTTGVNTPAGDLGGAAPDVRLVHLFGDPLEKASLSDLDAGCETASSRVTSGERCVEHARCKVGTAPARMVAVSRPELETGFAPKRLRPREPGRRDPGT